MRLDKVKKITTDSNIMTWIGLVIVALLAAWYTFFNPTKVSVENKIHIRGKLFEKPQYTKTDNGDYITIRLIGQEKSFDLRNCGLAWVNSDSIIKMNANDSIILQIDKDEFNKDFSFFNKSCEIYGIIIPTKGEILTISQINSCNKVEWKRILWMIPIMAFFLLIFLFIYFRKTSSNNRLDEQID